MQLIARLLTALALMLPFAGPGAAQPISPAALDNILSLDLKDGRVAIWLRPDVAPKHVERVKKLAREGFYDGLTFHRVIDGFMAQSGDPKGDGTGGSKYPDLKAEFSSEPFRRGSVGAARESGKPDSANSQFFICFDDASHLTGKYTLWGEVIRGMRHVDALKKGKSGSGKVSNPDKIIKAAIAADVKDHSVLAERPDPASSGPRGSFEERRGSF
jgi:peptidylprolyl isomerase